MKQKIILSSLLIVLVPQLSEAISMGSISDALSGQLAGSRAQPTLTAPIPKQTPETRPAPLQLAKQTAPSSTTTTEPSFPNLALFVEDAAMTAYIQSQLLLKKDIPHITVSTENAVVSLIGTVNNKEQADTIKKIASSVKGVKHVKTDQLVIRKN